MEVSGPIESWRLTAGEPRPPGRAIPATAAHVKSAYGVREWIGKPTLDLRRAGWDGSYQGTGQAWAAACPCWSSHAVTDTWSFSQFGLLL